MIYQFTSGEKFRGLEAQTVGEELERIRQLYDGLPTERVVEAAKRRSSPLHNAFTWNDAVAAHNHRMDEARDLIRCVLVRKTPDSEAIHAFIHVRLKNEDAGENQSTTEQYYQAVHVIATRPNEYDAAIRDSAARLVSAQRSLEELQRLAPNRKKEQRATEAKRHVEAARRALSPAV